MAKRRLSVHTGIGPGQFLGGLVGGAQSFVQSLQATRKAQADAQRAELEERKLRQEIEPALMNFNNIRNVLGMEKIGMVPKGTAGKEATKVLMNTNSFKQQQVYAGMLNQGQGQEQGRDPAFAGDATQAITGALQNQVIPEVNRVAQQRGVTPTGDQAFGINPAAKGLAVDPELRPGVIANVFKTEDGRLLKLPDGTPAPVGAQLVGRATGPGSNLPPGVFAFSAPERDFLKTALVAQGQFARGQVQAQARTQAATTAAGATKSSAQIRADAAKEAARVKAQALKNRGKKKSGIPTEVRQSFNASANKISRLRSGALKPESLAPADILKDQDAERDAKNLQVIMEKIDLAEKVRLNPGLKNVYTKSLRLTDQERKSVPQLIERLKKKKILAPEFTLDLSGAAPSQPAQAPAVPTTGAQKAGASMENPIQGDSLSNEQIKALPKGTWVNFKGQIRQRQK